MTMVNCDMGEGYGPYRNGDDAGLMPHIHVANVACGFHASDFNHMRATVQVAKSTGSRWAHIPRCPTARASAGAR